MIQSLVSEKVSDLPKVTQPVQNRATAAWLKGPEKGEDKQIYFEE